MEQPNLIRVNGWEFYRHDNGTLFPVLSGGTGDGPGVQAQDPGLVAQQTELLKMQVDTAKKGQALEPIMLQTAGLKYNPDTKAYEFLDPTTQANKSEIERLQTDRSLKALRGELPVTETLKKELELGQNRLNEKLQRQLGPGYALSTPGQMAQREYSTMATSLKEAEQRDMLTTAETLAINRGQNRTTNMQTFENPFASQARLLAPGATGVNSAIANDNTTRGMNLQSGMAGGQNTAGMISSGVGTMGMMAAMAMMSDPELKTDVEPVSDAAMLAAVRRIPVSRWRYKADPEKQQYIGGMADVMPEVVSDGHKYSVISYLGMLTSAVRALDKKLEKDRPSPAMLLLA